MKRLIITFAIVCLAITPSLAQNEADRAVATFVADLARLDKELASFTSMKCDKQMLSQFNIETSDPAMQAMLNTISRLYMVYAKDNTTAQLMRKRVQDLESRGMLNNYTEVKQDGNNVAIYLPSVMQMTYVLASVNASDQNIILVIADENFYNLVERLRTE